MIKTVHRINKYVVTPFSRKTYFISYSPKHKCLWFRVAKNASRTIDHHFRQSDPDYMYGSEVGYIPYFFRSWTKFAFVRNPVDRFLSCYQDKVVNHNLYGLKYRLLGDFIEYAKTLDLKKCDEHLRLQSVMIPEDFTLVGRVEMFNKHFSTIANMIDLEYESVVMNKTTKPYASNWHRREIEELYRLDMDNFETEIEKL